MRKLYRSRSCRLIAGICGGIAQAYSIDPTLVRLAFVFLALATGIAPLVITYIIGWIVIPEEKSP
ncbi:MAG: PspC domain-containing protein [Spirochaetota bacterium]